jgi:hypothetical protein
MAMIKEFVVAIIIFAVMLGSCCWKKAASVHDEVQEVSESLLRVRLVALRSPDANGL